MTRKPKEPCIHFFLPGKPRGKGRPRRAKNGGMFTPKQTRDYERAMRNLAGDFFRGPIAGPVKVTVNAYFHPPKKPARSYPPRPDIDNIVKIVLDAINGVAYQDDSQVVAVYGGKRYVNPAEDRTPEGVNVQIERLSLEDM